MRHAVCALVISPLDPRYILTVSRKDNPLDIGLPGGKVDPGETEIQAVVRETAEETGLTVQNPRAIFTRVCHGKEDFLVTTFLCDFPQGGVIQTPEAGKVAWATKDYLLSSSSFAAYNRALFDSIEARIG